MNRRSILQVFIGVLSTALGSKVAAKAELAISRVDELKDGKLPPIIYLIRPGDFSVKARIYLGDETDPAPPGSIQNIEVVQPFQGSVQIVSYGDSGRKYVQNYASFLDLTKRDLMPGGPDHHHFAEWSKTVEEHLAAGTDRTKWPLVLEATYQVMHNI